ncbi:MAG TPA: hypothetical protein VJ728_09865 [Candidatus Binataceae bacterium]|nr:hypothetical protein [Candidatus Binataceae bacterium]
MSRSLKVVILIALLTGWAIAATGAEIKALTQEDLVELLQGGVYNARIAELVRERGISFVPTERNLDALRRSGANLQVLDAIESAHNPTVQLPVSVGQIPRGETTHQPSQVSEHARNLKAQQQLTTAVNSIDGQAHVENCRAGHMYIADDIVGDPQACIRGSLSWGGGESMTGGVAGGMSGGW